MFGLLLKPLLGGLLGKKWSRKIEKVLATDTALQALDVVGEETEVRLISELQPPPVKGTSGDEFQVVGLIVRLTKKAKPA